MSSVRHLRRRLAALLALAVVTLAPGAALAWKMEAGTITLPDTYAGPKAFASFSFQQTYATPPLVFLLPTTTGPNPAAIRIRNVTTTGFEAAVVEPPGEDGPHIDMTVHYLAIEPGVHTLPDGTVIEAGTVSTTAVQHGAGVSGPESWLKVSLSHEFAKDPIALAQIQSMANESAAPPADASTPWLTVAVRNVKDEDLELALERSEAEPGAVTQDEVIAYLVMDRGLRGSFTDSGGLTVDYETIRSGKNIKGWDDGCSLIGFAGSYASAPLVLATKNTHEDNDGGWLRRCSLTRSRVGLKVDEDRWRDSERKHPGERAGIVVFSRPFHAEFLPPQPVAFYQMEEASWNRTAGEVRDATGNGNDGTGLGGATTDGATPAIPGSPGTCRYGVFASDGDGVDTGVDLDAKVGAQGTISFWFRPDWDQAGSEKNNARVLFDASVPSTSGNYFAGKYFKLAKLSSTGNYLDNDARQRLALLFEDAADHDFIVYTKDKVDKLGFKAGQWIHVAVTWDYPAGKVRIYVNGKEKKTQFAAGGGYSVGSFPDLDSLYLADNRSAYNPYGVTLGAGGAMDEVRIYKRVLTEAEIQADMNATHPCAALAGFTIDVGTGSASTCTPHAVTITAQSTAGGTLTSYTGTISLSTSSGHGTWSVKTASGTLSDPTADDGAATYTFVAADNGSIVLDLANVHADDLTITVSDAAAGVSSTSTVVSFRDNAFVVAPTTCTGASCPGTGSTEVVAGRGHGFRAELWRRDPSTGSCAIATAYDGSKGLKAWVVRDGDDPGGAAPSVAGTALPDAAPAANNLTLAFTAGVATFTLETTDVGKYAIALRDDTSGFAVDAGGNPRPIDGGSATLTVRPFALGFTDINAAGTANPGGTATGGAGFTAAGRAFSATVGGYLWQAADDADNDGLPDAGADVTDNGLTPSYAWATALSPSLHTPAGGVLGTLSGTTSIAAGSFSGGRATVSDLSYSEAGSIRISAAATGFLNTAGVDVTGTSPVIGRFHPDHLALVSSAITPADASGGYSYMGQPFTVAYTLEARNAAGGRTQNYDAARYTVGVAAISTVAENADDGNELSARLTVAGAGWSQGRYAVNDTAATFARAASPDGPFDQLAIGVKATGDPDGVQVQGLDMNAAATGCGAGCDARTLGTTRVRYGRLAILPAFGSELIDLNVPVRAEYFDGTAFALHTDDGASTGVTLALSDPEPGDALAPGDTCAWDSASETGIACAGAPPAGRDWREPPSAGDFNLWLKAPGKTGDLTLSATVPAWLRFDWDGDGNDDDPSARVSFGVFRGDEEMIYRREVY